MLVIKGSKIRSSNDATVQVPTRPFVEASHDESESLGTYLLPATSNSSQMMKPEGYHPPLLYVHEKFIDVVSYEAKAEGILEVTTTFSKKSTALVYVPESNHLPIFTAGSKLEANRALRMLHRYGGQDAYLALQGIDFDIRKIEAAFPNDHWVYSFEDDAGYIQKGMVYGTQINLDTLTPQLKTKGSPNQVGIFVSAKNMRMKVRVLNEGIQFYEFVPKHLLLGHPNHGNPWPYIVTVLQQLTAI